MTQRKIGMAAAFVTVLSLLLSVSTISAVPPGSSVATIEFEVGNPTPDDVYVSGSGYETGRIVRAEITRPDGSIVVQDVAVLTDGGVIGYRWPITGPGTYHFKHSQARGLHGHNAEVFEVKAEADYISP